LIDGQASAIRHTELSLFQPGWWSTTQLCLKLSCTEFGHILSPKTYSQVLLNWNFLSLAGVHGVLIINVAYTTAVIFAPHKGLPVYWRQLSYRLWFKYSVLQKQTLLFHTDHIFFLICCCSKTNADPNLPRV